MMIRKLLLLFIILTYTSLSAQNIANSSLREIYLGDYYEPGMINRYLSGDQWKNVWKSHITIPYYNQSELNVKVTEEISDSSCRIESFLLEGSDGSEYNFRTLFPEVTGLNDTNYQEFVSELTVDRISSTFPFGVLIAHNLLNEIGICSTSRVLIMLRLNNNNIPGYLSRNECGHNDAICTHEFLEIIYSDPYVHIDRRTYLKLRLLDILINNWEPTPFHRRWRVDATPSGKLLSPIPGEFSLSFSKFEGFIASTMNASAPQLNSFEKEYPPIRNITWNSRSLDRIVLSVLTKNDWNEVTDEFLDAVNDSSLIAAVTAIPRPIFEKVGYELIETLNARRNGLKKLSNDFYNYLNGINEIIATPGNDTLKVTRNNNGSISINLNFANGEKIIKEYNKEDTEELRVFLGSGEDVTEIKGNSEVPAPFVKVSGGADKDIFMDSSLVKANFFHFLPPRYNTARNYFYDITDSSVITESASSRVYNKVAPFPKVEYNVFAPLYKNRGTSFTIAPILNASRDEGVILGVRPNLTKYDFMLTPYDYKLTGILQYMTRTSGYIVGIESEFNSIIDGASVKLGIQKSENVADKFYGYGNGTTYSNDLYNDGYFDVNQELLIAELGISFNTGKVFEWGVGTRYKYSESSPNTISLLDNFNVENKGIGNFALFSLDGYFQIDTRDNKFNPQYGFLLKNSGEYFPKMLDNNKMFWKLASDLDAFYTFIKPSKITFNLKAGIKRIWNEFPFFESAFIGGQDKLPGYRDNRFAGRSAVYATIKNNYYITNINLLTNLNFGISSLLAAGRVFINTGKSDEYHYSYGGGLWMSGFGENFFSEVFVALNQELTSVYFTSKFRM